MYKQDIEDDEIDLLALAYALWQHILIILISMVICGAVAFGYSKYLVAPQYRSEAMLYVNNNSISFGGTSLSISNGDITAAQNLVDTYIVILKSRLNLEAVINKAKLGYTYEELNKMVTAAAVNGTEIFKVSVTSNDPVEAELIANTIAQVLPKKISDVVEGSSVKIVDYAVVPNYKVSPSITKYTLIGFAIGAVISCGVIIVMELMNNKIREEDYLIDTYDLPIMATIPDIVNGSKHKKGGYSYSYGYGYGYGYGTGRGREKSSKRGKGNG